MTCTLRLGRLTHVLVAASVDADGNLSKSFSDTETNSSNEFTCNEVFCISGGLILKLYFVCNNGQLRCCSHQGVFLVGSADVVVL